MKPFTLKEYNDFQCIKHNKVFLEQVINFNEKIRDIHYIESILRDDSPDNLWGSYNDALQQFQSMKNPLLEMRWSNYFNFLTNLE